MWKLREISISHTYQFSVKRFRKSLISICIADSASKTSLNLTKKFPCHIHSAVRRNLLTFLAKISWKQHLYLLNYWIVDLTKYFFGENKLSIFPHYDIVNLSWSPFFRNYMKVHVTLALTQRLDGNFGTQAHIRLLNDLKK